MQRIETLIRLVPPCSRVIDVGADHGLVSLGLAEREDIEQILATDISAASLAKLKQALERADSLTKQKITLFVTDGLQDLPWQSADTLLIAGMGGPLIMRILSESFAFAQSAGTWVLSPQSGIPAFRRYLQCLSCRVEETIVEEEGKFYPLFLVFPREACPPQSGYAHILTEQEEIYGPDLLRLHHPFVEKQIRKDQAHWHQLLQQLEGKSSRGARERRKEAQAALCALSTLLSR